LGGPTNLRMEPGSTAPHSCPLAACPGFKPRFVGPDALQHRLQRPFVLALFTRAFHGESVTPLARTLCTPCASSSKIVSQFVGQLRGQTQVLTVRPRKQTLFTAQLARLAAKSLRAWLFCSVLYSMLQCYSILRGRRRVYIASIRVQSTIKQHKHRVALLVSDI